MEHCISMIACLKTLALNQIDLSNMGELNVFATRNNWVCQICLTNSFHHMS